jgi:HEAT repeat protein
MSIRFHCDQCAYQIVLQSPRPGGVTCPSCGVTLLPLAEAAAAPPPTALQTAPNPAPAVVPLRPIALPARPASPVRHIGMIAAAVAVAVLLVGGVLGWTAFTKRDRQPAAGALGRLDRKPAESPPDAGPYPDPDKREILTPVPSDPPAERHTRPLRDRPATIENPTPTPPEKQDLPAPEVKEQPPVKPAAPFKRRDRLSEEELRKQLVTAPEVSLDQVPRTSTELQNLARKMSTNNVAFQGPAVLLSKRTDLQGLPLRMGGDCQLGKEPAENMQVLSKKMRVVLEKTMAKDDPRPDADKLRDALLNDTRLDWLQPEAVPCLLQLLQAENAPVRKVLVQVLGEIKDRRATQALAVRAMMDLSPEVREAAARQLADRPREDYEPLLLAGLRYPWPAAATHAAETLAFLKDADALPQLVTMLDQPDPALPFTVRQGNRETSLIREVVRINHLSNCMLCHPPSFVRTDFIRGAVPTPGQPLPAPATTPQYYENGSVFVRADQTYLRQDFSVMQPVEPHGEWPKFQRFDYLVRTRVATPQETHLALQKKFDGTANEAHAAALFALREISGKNLGTTARDWRPLVDAKITAKIDNAKADDRVGPDWQQFVSTASAAPDLSDEADARRLKNDVLAAPKDEQEKLLHQLADAKGLPYTDALADAAAKLYGPAQTKARDLLAERLVRMTEATLRDRLGEDSAELRRAAARAVGMKNAKALTADLLPLLSDQDPEVIQAARLSLKALTNEDFGPQPDADRAGREKAAESWKAWWKKKSEL